LDNPIDHTSNLSTTAYQCRQTGRGHTYREQLKQHLQGPHGNLSLRYGSLKTHVHRLHGTELEKTLLLDDPTTPCKATSPTPYRISFRRGTTRHSPVPQCFGHFKTHEGLRRHYMTRHSLDSLCILEEGGQPLPRCARCDMHVPYTALNRNHPTSQACQRGTKLKIQRKKMIIRQAKKDSILLFDTALPIVLMFCYLGRILAANNSDWPALHRNLQKAKCKWTLISCPLSKTGVSPRHIGYFYKAIVQSVLLYWSETWTVTPQMLATLDGFHHQIARKIANQQPIRHPDNTWTYPSIKKHKK
jgi:hypothetical protein